MQSFSTEMGWVVKIIIFSNGFPIGETLTMETGKGNFRHKDLKGWNMFLCTRHLNRKLKLLDIA